MKILLHDIIQKSGAPDSIKSPALADRYDYTNGGPFSAALESPGIVDCVGIGNTDAKNVTFYITRAAADLYDNGGAGDTPGNQWGWDAALGYPPDYMTYEGTEGGHLTVVVKPYANGLYLIPKIMASSIDVECDGTYIGRIAAGRAVNIPTSVQKEPGWASTASPRVTLSGQVIPGRGGYTYRTLSLDSRYQMGPEAVEELIAGYEYIGQGYPFFLDLSAEAHKLPYDKFYGEEKDQLGLSLESGIYRYRYSKKWDFTERF